MGTHLLGVPAQNVWLRLSRLHKIKGMYLHKVIVSVKAMLKMLSKVVIIM